MESAKMKPTKQKAAANYNHGQDYTPHCQI